LADKGYTYRQVIHHETQEGMDWLIRILQSYYCRFGGWKVRPEDSVFRNAAFIGFAGLGLTLLGQLLFRKRMSVFLVTCLLAAPIVIGLNVFGALWYSLHVDYQPQG